MKSFLVAVYLNWVSVRSKHQNECVSVKCSCNTEIIIKVQQVTMVTASWKQTRQKENQPKNVFSKAQHDCPLSILFLLFGSIHPPKLVLTKGISKVYLLSLTYLNCGVVTFFHICEMLPSASAFRTIEFVLIIYFVTSKCHF